MLVDAGTNVNNINLSGYSVFTQMMNTNPYLAVARLLIMAGADVNSIAIRTVHGWNGLQIYKTHVFSRFET